MKKIVILGSTGSIGKSALRVVEALPANLKVVGLAVNREYRAVLQQAARFHVRHVAVADPAAARRCDAEAPPEVQVYGGPEGSEILAAMDEADLILSAVVGMAGLRPVLAAVGKGKNVALATKEVLVAAGQIVRKECARTGARLLPVDSEHCAIFQCLNGARGDALRDGAAEGQGIRRLLLTASGGPFGARPEVDFDNVTVREALAHPRWNMGRKVTVDSATLMNKGLEVMEAHWLFGVPVDRIEVILHPESLVHSMVEFHDGNMLAQLSEPDMRFAIQYALTWPDRLEGGLQGLDLARVGALHFSRPDEKRFPCLRLARRAAATGGTLPAVLNAANEVAVQEFLEGRIRFPGIWLTVESVMDKHTAIPEATLRDVVEADDWARKAAMETVRQYTEKGA